MRGAAGASPAGENYLRFMAVDPTTAKPAEEVSCARHLYYAHPAVCLKRMRDDRSGSHAFERFGARWLSMSVDEQAHRERGYFACLLSEMAEHDDTRFELLVHEGRSHDAERHPEVETVDPDGLYAGALTPSTVELILALDVEILTVRAHGVVVLELSGGWLHVHVWIADDQLADLAARLETASWSAAEALPAEQRVRRPVRAAALVAWRYATRIVAVAAALAAWGRLWDLDASTWLRLPLAVAVVLALIIAIASAAERIERVWYLRPPRRLLSAAA